MLCGVDIVGIGEPENSAPRPDRSCHRRRPAGIPSHVAPDCERILIETGVRAAEQLFPDAPPWDWEQGWTASGALPAPLPPDPLLHPDRA